MRVRTEHRFTCVFLDAGREAGRHYRLQLSAPNMQYVVSAAVGTLVAISPSTPLDDCSNISHARSKKSSELSHHQAKTSLPANVLVASVDLESSSNAYISTTLSRHHGAREAPNPVSVLNLLTSPL
jgi:hypothetical protein